MYSPTPLTARPERLLRLPDVQQRVGLGKTQIYKLIHEGLFPGPIKLSKRAVAWPESRVTKWISDRTDVVYRGTNSHDY